MKESDGRRRSPGRPRVPFDRIIAAALRIVDEDGADALSMRTLAQRLDTGTATLYRAVANRGELVAHVVDCVFGEIELDPDAMRGADWEQVCLLAGQAIFDTLSRHRGVAPLLIGRVPTGPHAMVHREWFLAMLLGNGFSGEAAARAYATIARYVLGFAIQLPRHGAADSDAAEVSSLYHQLDPEAFPATLAVADSLPTATLEEEFAFGLRLIVAGLAGLRRGA
ncbi:TetR/AcrR family transcriptional regulator [Nocardia sp.]|uniref:TetR/AcrR family transcriptional regulator n=1 Tax=Nocardia sp. TaxID=1821 RepID=UPI00262B38CF|nr:TetR/AcrR family transcriptional regulator C-terminal domain-containing protein [Nocardia sp.]